MIKKLVRHINLIKSKIVVKVGECKKLKLIEMLQRLNGLTKTVKLPQEEFQIYQKLQKR